MTLAIDVIRVSMPLAQWVTITVGAFAAGVGVGVWIRR